MALIVNLYSLDCDCNKQGTFFFGEPPYCDKTTGVCECIPPYEGDKCDSCYDGFWGGNPYCQGTMHMF